MWLDQCITDSTFLKTLLMPYPADQIIAYEVSPLVNSVKNNGPECLVAVGGGCFSSIDKKHLDRSSSQIENTSKPAQRAGLDVFEWVMRLVMTYKVLADTRPLSP